MTDSTNTLPKADSRDYAKRIPHNMLLVRTRKTAARLTAVRYGQKGHNMKTADVFGVSNEQIASYIEREEVDARFVEGLKRNKHIIQFRGHPA